MIDSILQLDQNILLFIQNHIRQEWMDWFWKGITHLGDGGIFWILLTIVLLIPKKTRKAGIAAVFALVIGALITNLAVKNLVARTRPYEVIQGLRLMIEKQSDFSFPSGHTCASFSAAYALYRTKQVIPKKWGIAALILATLIALSRLYVGVHYPTDVLGGLVIGLFSGWAGWKLEEVIVKKRAEKKQKN